MYRHCLLCFFKAPTNTYKRQLPRSQKCTSCLIQMRWARAEKIAKCCIQISEALWRVHWRSKRNRSSDWLRERKKKRKKKGERERERERESQTNDATFSSSFSSLRATLENRRFYIKKDHNEFYRITLRQSDMLCKERKENRETERDRDRDLSEKKL